MAVANGLVSNVLKCCGGYCWTISQLCSKEKQSKIKGGFSFCDNCREVCLLNVTF